MANPLPELNVVYVVGALEKEKRRTLRELELYFNKEINRKNGEIPVAKYAGQRISKYNRIAILDSGPIITSSSKIDYVSVFDIRESLHNHDYAKKIQNTRQYDDRKEISVRKGLEKRVIGIKNQLVKQLIENKEKEYFSNFLMFNSDAVSQTGLTAHTNLIKKHFREGYLENNLALNQYLIFLKISKSHYRTILENERGEKLHPKYILPYWEDIKKNQHTLEQNFHPTKFFIPNPKKENDADLMLSKGMCYVIKSDAPNIKQTEYNCRIIAEIISGSKFLIKYEGYRGNLRRMKHLDNFRNKQEKLRLYIEKERAKIIPVQTVAA